MKIKYFLTKDTLQRIKQIKIIKEIKENSKKDLT